MICAGKIGSGMGAELGSMKVTEQIDAMEVSGTNPFKYLGVYQSYGSYDYGTCNVKCGQCNFFVWRLFRC
ncbi:ABC transporter permease [Citricoccus parietis]|uniref:ABC transporter permease n=1 Tax=Citricoccus parietis TaxID=592307 RepID=A0ABV5G8F0_9MICC